MLPVGGPQWPRVDVLDITKTGGGVKAIVLPFVICCSNRGSAPVMLSQGTMSA